MEMTWRLETIYPTEEAFQAEVARAKELLSYQGPLKERIVQAQEAACTIRQLEAYAECLLAQDTRDPVAHQKNALLSDLLAELESLLFALGSQLAELQEKPYQELLDQLPQIAFYVREMRESALQKAPKEQEALINALSADGYHSMWALFQSITGKMQIGKNKLSVGQAQNALHSANREERIEVFAEWQEAFKNTSDLLAQILNSIGGFRLKIYAARGWDDIILEPLLLNRMKKETFESMWKAIEKAKPAFLQYLAKKAELLGVDKLSWVDVSAPIGSPKEIDWEEACRTLIERFTAFHPKKGAFVKRALESQWVEAEDRPGKAAGGFCVMLPKIQESRIFMTFQGTANNVATLAHELGHAYHNECVKHLPYFHQQAQMNVAETASTFAEMVIIDHQIASAKTEDEKRQLLDDKLERSVAFFMNLHARLLFEMQFYQERKSGFVSAERLNTLMEEAQKEAYCHALADWDPTFWASKLHFFYTHFPFYNFPYTFGYLMSNGLYAHIQKTGQPDALDAFLEDTGQMGVEELAEKHLGVDLTKPDFWEESLRLLQKDIQDFVS